MDNPQPVNVTWSSTSYAVRGTNLSSSDPSVFSMATGWNYQKPDHMANLVTAFRHLTQAVLELETLLRG